MGKKEFIGHSFVSHQHHVNAGLIGADATRSSGQRAETLEEGGNSLYLTDDRGNVMKVSQSSIFEMSNDHPF